MRNNQPVTNVETLLPEGQFIYSRTDLNGQITEANEAFARISAYEREEMLGQPHNLVRHPDMPTQAFEDMWRDLKAGRPWRGLVKNRRKDGGYYWVVANASPVRENGRVVGYQSVRSRPSRDEVAAASDAYARLKRGDRGIQVVHGRIVPSRQSLWTGFSSLRCQAVSVGVALLAVSAMLLAYPSLPAGVATYLAYGAGGLGLLLSLIFLLLFVPRLLGDFSAASAYLERVLTSGDLKSRFELAREDQLGVLVHEIAQFVSWIQSTIQGIGDTSHQVRRATSEVADGVHNVDQSARVQSDATASAAAGIEEITVSISEVAAHAQATRDSAALAAEASAKGARLSADASRTILDLAETVKVSAAQVADDVLYFGDNSGTIHAVDL